MSLVKHALFGQALFTRLTTTFKPATEKAVKFSVKPPVVKSVVEQAKRSVGNEIKLPSQKAPSL